MAGAQDYPTKPTTIVVAYAPGGATDVVARALGQRLSEAWGRPVIIENKGGANTQLAAGYVAKAEPDGYTLLATSDSTFVVNPYLYPRLPYDPVKDFVPIAGLASINQALVVHPSLAAAKVADLIALAKAEPGGLDYANFGPGSAPHLCMELFQNLTGTKFNAIQYRGGGPVLTDVIAGHVPITFLNVGLVVEASKAGRLRALGVSSDERLSEFPDVPTIAETVPGFRATTRFGLFAPHGTPQGVVDKINADLQRILSEREFREKFLAPNFYVPVTGSPGQFAETIRIESERWGKLIKDVKITVDE